VTLQSCCRSPEGRPQDWSLQLPWSHGLREALGHTVWDEGAAIALPTVAAQAEQQALRDALSAARGEAQEAAALAEALRRQAEQAAQDASAVAAAQDATLRERDALLEQAQVQSLT
jgi:hypothetical protein